MVIKKCPCSMRAIRENYTSTSVDGCLCQWNESTLTKAAICRKMYATAKIKTLNFQTSIQGAKKRRKKKAWGTELLTSTTDFIGIIAVKVAHTAIDISERECTEICGLTAEEDRKGWIYYVDSHRLVPHSTHFFRKNCVLYTLYL